MDGPATGSPALWRPASEPEAASNMAAFIEWCRATGLGAYGSPAAVSAALLDDPGRVRGAAGAFAGLDPALGWRGNLRRGAGPRAAVARVDPVGRRRSWSFDDIACSDAAWIEAAGCRADGDYGALLTAVADQVLRAETRPGDVVTFRGPSDDPWPWGALAIGACIVLHG